MSKALFAGSFNPFTVGHKSVVDYADGILRSLGGGSVDIGITQNPNKPGQNLHLLKWITNPVFSGFDSKRVKVVDNPLLVEYMLANEYRVLVRSFRNAIDIIHELDMAVWNEAIGAMRTMYVPAERMYEHISSSAIRDLDSLNVNMSHYLNDIQYARWKNGRPKRIIVCGGDGMGCGKSSFIKDYTVKILRRRLLNFDNNIPYDMDEIVNKRLGEESKLTFRKFFKDTDVDDVYSKWYAGTDMGLVNAKSDVEKLVTNHIDEHDVGVYEISAFTAYNLRKYYNDSIIVYVKHYDNGKKRDIDPAMAQKTKELQTTPSVVDFIIDDREHGFQDTIDALIKTYNG